MAMMGEEFRGTGRFAIERRLGMGGMGVVYAALDRQRNVKVALKTLRSFSAASVLRFKREFHALHDIQHPNLVTLGELYEEDGTWFFTMELVEGVNFLDYLRPGAPPQPASDLTDVDFSSTSLTPTASPAQRMYAASLAAPGPRYDEARLRSSLAQLVRGLSALHNAGKVHRDVKPSNIMVGGNGRVVLLDFGLVAESDPSASLTGDDAVGTAIYMAPEQAVGHSVDVKADWYSVGVLLYEALVGAPPFVGHNLKILIDKQRVTPVAPRSLCPDVPEDLDEICSALLQIEPRRRPSGEAILRRLGVHDKPSVTTMPPLARASVHTQTQLLVGRDHELAQLERALADTRAGHQVSVYINGESGIGKSTLVRSFCTAAAADERVIVLSGRCYERDSVPYKALDGVIDTLSRTMQRLPKLSAIALIPHRASLLLQVFPVLKHVDVLADAPPHEVLDPQELRKLVFGALRELFTRMAERYTLIVAIDDLQWADPDGLALLEELLRPPEAPPFLLLATWREAEDQHGLRQRLERLPGDARHHKLTRLSEEAAAELASALIVRANDSGLAGSADAENIAREAKGHPLFIDELVRHSVLVSGRAGAEDITARPVRLEDVLGERIARLDPTARGILEVAAIAGTPLEQETAARALGMTPAGFGRQATVLRAMHLVRTTGSSGADTIEPYHDRVRSAVLERLRRDEREVRHRELARALDASGRADPEALVEHYCGAKEPEKAGQCAVLAAQGAERALAFDQAARLYQLALALLPEDYPTRRTLRIALGDALTNAGRGAEAAQAFTAAAHGATAADALDLRRRAAEQLLVTGHIDEGMVAMRSVLALEGIAYPETPTRALMSILYRRLKLKLRGFGFTERDESLITAKELSRLDVCFNVGLSLAIADTIRGQAFQIYALLMALRAGEPQRLTLSLSTEAVYRAAVGGRGHAQATKLLDTADEQARKVAKAHPQIFALGARGQAAFLGGRFRAAAELCERAESLLRERCVGAAWEISTTRLWRSRSLLYLGELAQLSAYLPETIRSCAARSDLVGTTSLGVSVMPFVHLAADEPELARSSIVESLSRWSTAGYHLQHYYASISQASTSLYAGEPARAHETALATWQEVVRARMKRLQIVRVVVLDMRARAALGLAAGDQRERPRLLGEASRDARRIERDGFLIGPALALLVRAQIASLRGDVGSARTQLEQAAHAFDRVDMALHAAVARRCLGQLIGGGAGQALVAQADTFMTAQKIKRPERIVAMLAPGLRP